MARESSSRELALGTAGKVVAPRVPGAGAWGWLKKSTQAAWGFLLPIVGIAVWEWLARAGFLPPWQLPAPSDIFWTLVELHTSGDLYRHAATSILRVLTGFAVGGTLGAIVGMSVGLWKSVERLIDLTLQAIKSVPTLGWVPLLILWFGIGEASKLTLIAIGSFFPVYVNVVAGVRGVDRSLIEVGKSHCLSQTGLLFRIILPSAAPSFLTGARVALTRAWLFMVIAELMAADQGLGFLLTVGREVGRPDLLLCSLAVLAVLGKLTDSVIRTCERRILSWRDTVHE